MNKTKNDLAVALPLREKVKGPTMHRTKNDLSEDLRKKMIAVLNLRLADSIDLNLRAKHAHWNVKGPHFFALHELFDKVAEGAEEWSDDLAERAVQLGGIAEGLVSFVKDRSNLGEYPPDIFEGQDHVEALSSTLAVFCRQIRRDIDQAAKAGDQTTSDLFTEISRAADKQLWFVEAHLQGRSNT
ncbi:MAG TPA: DNA starvation/stationary phase protection protein Dps [Planctomycetota bacterium]|nr:DNA starvation/stationary phase protection protein Dps [Planctomycetota bacterium]